MSSGGSDSPDEQITRTGAALARIADLLGCPVETFTSGHDPPHEVRGASELLTIWMAMGDDGDRERLLRFARTLAGAR